MFLSANPRNIKVFRAITDHDIIRTQIIEIIWDDGRLKDRPNRRRSGHPLSPHYDPEFDEFTEIGDFETIDDKEEEDKEEARYPTWFAKAYQRNLNFIQNHEANDTDRPDQAVLAEFNTPTSLARSWEYYYQLLQQQKEVLVLGADVKAFKYGLLRLPALQRITITPAAYGWLLRPLYETPMIQAFPPNFNYPMPYA